MRDKIRAAWPDILTALAAGDLVSRTLARHDLKPTAVRLFREESSEANMQWENAREQSADAYMDKAIRTAETDVAPQDAAHARTRIDTYKWAARIRNPKLYGDRQNIQLDVRTVDLTRIISDANARLQAARVIEGVVVRPLLESGERAGSLSDLL